MKESTSETRIQPITKTSPQISYKKFWSEEKEDDIHRENESKYVKKEAKEFVMYRNATKIEKPGFQNFGGRQTRIRNDAQPQT